MFLNLRLNFKVNYFKVVKGPQYIFLKCSFVVVVRRNYKSIGQKIFYKKLLK